MTGINKIILGTAQFGLNYGINNTSGIPSQHEVFKILDYALEQQIRILDTADAYGKASEIIGNYNALNPGRFLVNTKFISGSIPLTEQIEKSIAILKVDHLNVLFYHCYSDFINFPLKQKELESLKKGGKISKIGVSVYDNKEFKTAIESEIIQVIQFPFNMLDNLFQREYLIKYAKVKGKELQSRSVFLQGLFFKPLNDIPPKLASLKPYLERLANMSEIYNIPIGTLALSYALQQTGIDNVIIGVDNLLHLKQNLRAFKKTIPYEIYNLINRIRVKEKDLLYPKNWRE
jgi:aryl-alcohol dehydrogenase-like predicted oxidoreductase